VEIEGHGGDGRTEQLRHVSELDMVFQSTILVINYYYLYLHALALLHLMSDVLRPQLAKVLHTWEVIPVIEKHLLPPPLLYILFIGFALQAGLLCKES